MNPNCQIGYHSWRDGGSYWECIVCHLVERKSVDSGRGQ